MCAREAHERVGSGRERGETTRGGLDEGVRWDDRRRGRHEKKAQYDEACGGRRAQSAGWACGVHDSITQCFARRAKLLKCVGSAFSDINREPKARP
jgi:hypothetical protein